MTEGKHLTPEEIAERRLVVGLIDRKTAPRARSRRSLTQRFQSDDSAILLENFRRLNRRLIRFFSLREFARIRKETVSQ
jgi:hypothetical protein